jgi:hypothetical protein
VLSAQCRVRERTALVGGVLAPNQRTTTKLSATVCERPPALLANSNAL